jgi:hypothetical protein
MTSDQLSHQPTHGGDAPGRAPHPLCRRVYGSRDQREIYGAHWFERVVRLRRSGERERKPENSMLFSKKVKRCSAVKRGALIAMRLRLDNEVT